MKNINRKKILKDMIQSEIVDQFLIFMGTIGFSNFLMSYLFIGQINTLFEDVNNLSKVNSYLIMLFIILVLMDFVILVGIDYYCELNDDILSAYNEFADLANNVVSVIALYTASISVIYNSYDYSNSIETYNEYVKYNTGKYGMDIYFAVINGYTLEFGICILAFIVALKSYNFFRKCRGERNPLQKFFNKNNMKTTLAIMVADIGSRFGGGIKQLASVGLNEENIMDYSIHNAIEAGFEHFMMKEIHEQPKVVRDTLNSVLKDGQIDLSAVGLSEEEIKDISQIYIVACGSAYHVGIAAQYVIEDLAKIPVRVELGSEFRYRNPLLDPKGLVIVISQSGETADSLAALRESKEKGVRTMAIVNVVGSSIAREADSVFYTLAGPEIAVATTKAYSTQLMATYILALQFAKVRGEISDETYKNMIAELQTIPDKIAKILEDKERIQWFASKQANAHDVFFVGRGIDYAICMEGSLKMKEISYIHSEAYAAGELKHGTISLIEDDILVVGVLTQPDLYEKTISNMVECRSRGAYLMGLTTFGQYNIEDSTDFAVYIPKIDPHFATSLAVIPLQLLGYYISVAKGLDVDKPRNLAKSVTVE